MTSDNESPPMVRHSIIPPPVQAQGFTSYRPEVPSPRKEPPQNQHQRLEPEDQAAQIIKELETSKAGLYPPRLPRLHGGGGPY